MPASAIQSVVSPAGPQASAIYHLWSLMLWSSTVVYVMVLCVLCWALIHGLRGSNVQAEPAARDRRLGRIVGAGVSATIVILLVLLVASVWTGRQTASLHAESAVSVSVVGHQWWWEIEYEDAVPSRRVLTANEVHIPVNRPVVFKVTSRDVIHSLWLPNLQGKRDLIPGYTTAIWMEADRPGIFRGQCAEFCGLQHAHMALDVVAEPEAAFERWLDGMRQPATEPRTDVERRGRDVFMTARCVGCHSINGTEAHGQAGPDLTHVAIRSTLGAGTLSNSRDHLRDWIRNPHATKPGIQMPANPLTSEDLESLLTYLESLR